MDEFNLTNMLGFKAPTPAPSSSFMDWLSEPVGFVLTILVYQFGKWLASIIQDLLILRTLYLIDKHRSQFSEEEETTLQQSSAWATQGLGNFTGRGTGIVAAVSWLSYLYTSFTASLWLITLLLVVDWSGVFFFSTGSRIIIYSSCMKDVLGEAIRSRILRVYKNVLPRQRWGRRGHQV